MTQNCQNLYIQVKDTQNGDIMKDLVSEVNVIFEEKVPLARAEEIVNELSYVVKDNGLYDPIHVLEVGCPKPTDYTEIRTDFLAYSEVTDVEKNSDCHTCED